MGNLKKVDHLNQVGQSDLCDISKANHLIQGVANGPLKTNGLAKFRQISRVSQSRFLAVMCVSQSRFFSRLRKSSSTDLPFFFYKVK